MFSDGKLMFGGCEQLYADCVLMFGDRELKISNYKNTSFGIGSDSRPTSCQVFPQLARLFKMQDEVYPMLDQVHKNRGTDKRHHDFYRFNRDVTRISSDSRQ